jgi:STAS-like domain of unknown function (DUF4325)
MATMTKPMMTIRLSDELGPALVGRIPGREIRDRIERSARSGEVVELDFEGVTVVSPSFADEVFARIDPALVESGVVQFTNLSEHLTAVAGFLRRARGAS